jgi:acyl carrier protein
MTVREIVMKQLAEVVELHSLIPFSDDITDDTRLDEFMLDSIAFTALMSQIEEQIGSLTPRETGGMTYPQTIGELVAMYTDVKRETL